MTILIRPWQRGDLPAVRRILWESWRATYGPFIPEEDLRSYLDEAYQLDSLEKLYEYPFVHGAIGEMDGEAVGFARMQFHADENRLYLASLYLLPDHKGKGIGAKLLKAAEEKALEHGLVQLWVGVMAQNLAARRWYDEKGFRFVKEEPFRMGKTTVPNLVGFKMIKKNGEEAMLRRRCSGVFDGREGSPPLAGLAADLLESQKKAWSKLGEGYAALAAARTREIGGDGPGVLVQWNAQRLTSSAARVDPASIRKRSCFLCWKDLPAKQKGILYRGSYLILCNPAPIFPAHYTIAHLGHRPQMLEGRLDDFLRLAEDFGPRTTLFYNGPRCGASAPDHLHFQAVPAGFLPVEGQVREQGNLVLAGQKSRVMIFRTAGLGRGAVVLMGRSAGAVGAVLGDVIEALRRPAGEPDEPKVNLLGTYTGEMWRLILFPRRRHRPEAYDREGAERLVVSPGAVDMGGVFITPREEDFLALNPGLVEGIFREVAFTDADIDALLGSL